MWAGKSQCWNFCLRSIFCSRFISSWVAVSCITNMPAKELLRPGHGICRLKNICIHVQGFMSLPAIARYEAKLPRSWVSAITLCKARLPKSRVSCAFAFDMQHHIKFWCSCCFTKKGKLFPTEGSCSSKFPFCLSFMESWIPLGWVRKETKQDSTLLFEPNWSNNTYWSQVFGFKFKNIYFKSICKWKLLQPIYSSR